jgi:hypothetical protein
METPADIDKKEVEEQLKKGVEEQLKKVEHDTLAEEDALAKELIKKGEQALNNRLEEEKIVAATEKKDEEELESLLKQVEEVKEVEKNKDKKQVDEFEKANKSIFTFTVKEGVTVMLDGAQVASYTMIATEVLKVSLKGAEFFAEVGSSLPIIGVALKFAAMVGKQIKGHYELHKILDELKVILKELQKLLKLIQFVYNTFRDEIRNFYTARINKMREANGLKLEELKKLLKELKELFKIKLHPVIELKVKEKLKVIVDILKSIKGASESDDSPVTIPQQADPNRSSFTRIASALGSATKSFTSSAQKFGSYVKRTVLSLSSASTYKDEVLQAMIFENSLMFLYHSQYIMVIHEYEEALRKITPVEEVDKRDGNELIESIWDKIKKVEHEADGKKKSQSI